MNTTIQALQMELEKLKSQPSSQITLSTNAAVQNVSVEDLASKLLAYQQYMAQYMVRASEEKLKAVKLAEAAIAKKYEEKLNAFLLNAAPSSTSSDSATTAMTVTTGVPATKSLYTDRNTNVVEAAKAGKSRWGDMEVRKAESLVASSTQLSQPTTTSSSSSTVNNIIPPEVVAADKGLRKEGAVGGITLAERVAFGSKASSVDVKPTQTSSVDLNSAETELYHKRNVMVSAAAKAGKQRRWGAQEVERAVALAGSSLPSTPASSSSPSAVAPRVNIGAKILDSATTPTLVVKQPTLPLTEVISLADKGLRKEGAVMGSTLAERVTLGSKLNTVSPASVSILNSEETILYHKRNEMVSAAAKAGKQSRWGPREEQRAVSLAGFSLPSTPFSPSSPSAVVQRVNIGAKILDSATSPTVVAKQPTLPLTEVISLADKGLRKEGAVAGSTLAERVTLGSKLNTVPPESVSILNSEETILYHKRNEMVSAATKAGKQSRWGPREEQRAVALAGFFF
jgi:hypothetical protein